MADYKHDGGPAFPDISRDTQRGELLRYDQGLTVRDYFAAHALAGMLANGFMPGTDTGTTYHEKAYVMADLMLKARA